MAIENAQTPYPMLRGSEQVTRVNLIQFVWSGTLGYLLHPEIPEDVSKVADVATASGLWLCELNRPKPGFNALDGYDISPESFLLARDRPSNVNLKAMDAQKEVPEALKGKYDVVHIRCIKPGVQDGDVSRIVDHCKDLLRPGGYLQWEEFDTSAYEVHVNDGVSRPSSLEQVVETFNSILVKDWVPDLPKTLQGHGWSVTAVERLREPIWHGLIMTHLVCGVINEVSIAKLDVIGPPGAGEQLRSLLKKGLEENLQGSYISSMFQVVVAQKTQDI